MKDHANVVRPVEEVVIELLWAKKLLQKDVSLGCRKDMQYLIKEPYDLCGRHSMV
jgi:hypothetical protein